MIKRIVGIIPARGGSKGLKRKNIKLLNGKPLILYTIEAALNAKTLDKVIVSTEDEEIAEVARDAGATVIMRPHDLAEDHTPALPVIKHVINILKGEGYEPEATVFLQPTSPLRNATDIDEAVEHLVRTGYNSVVSVRPLEINPYGLLDIKDGKIEHFIKDRPKRHPRRQDLPDLYRYNGAIWASLTAYTMSQDDHVIDPDDCGVYVMPHERSVDIDDEIDFALAEILIKKHLDKD
jgi:CMP-N,N'-diacetyllegionaminic acid synthase